jgi:preprotein translocase subunit SecF
MNWLRIKPLYGAISALILIPGLWSLLTFGLKPAVDFTGGSRISFSSSEEQLEEAIREELPGAALMIEGETLTVETATMTQTDLDELTLRLMDRGLPNEVQSFFTVGPSAGALLLRQTLLASALAAGAILLYISMAFKSVKYGLCAVAAMSHDSLVLLGVFSLLGRFLGVQVDLLFVTAVLTTLSFSVHDTIVVFDRIRELSHKNRNQEFEDLGNRAITETMIRSLNNSLTIIFMLLALILLGGESIRWFAVALFIGAITGTYSSPFVAVPLLAVWHQTESRIKRPA